MGAEHRSAPRHDLRWQCLIVDMAGEIVGRCTVVNVAISGARIMTKEAAEVPENFVLILSKNGGVRRHCEVVWRKKSDIGVRFVQPQVAEREFSSYVDDTLARIGPKA
jgi:hypothetical protein